MLFRYTAEKIIHSKWYTDKACDVKAERKRIVETAAAIDCFIEWLEAHPPFQSRPTTMLVSLSTGLIADGSVNCDDALRVGLNSQKDMVGQNFAEVKIHRKNRVK